MAVFLVLILFLGSFTAGSRVFSNPVACSTATTTTGSMDKEVIIPIQVKNFILNQIVNKSKAAIVIGLVNPSGTRIFSFGNMSKAHNVSVNQNSFHYYYLLDISVKYII